MTKFFSLLLVATALTGCTVQQTPVADADESEAAATTKKPAKATKPADEEDETKADDEAEQAAPPPQETRAPVPVPVALKRWSAKVTGRTNIVFYGAAQTVNGATTGPCRALAFAKATATVETDDAGNIASVSFAGASQDLKRATCTNLTLRADAANSYTFNTETPSAKEVDLVEGAGSLPALTTKAAIQVSSETGAFLTLTFDNGGAGEEKISLIVRIALTREGM